MKRSKYVIPKQLRISEEGDKAFERMKDLYDTSLSGYLNDEVLEPLQRNLKTIETIIEAINSNEIVKFRGSVATELSLSNDGHFESIVKNTEYLIERDTYGIKLTKYIKYLDLNSNLKFNTIKIQSFTDMNIFTKTMLEVLKVVDESTIEITNLKN